MVETIEKRTIETRDNKEQGDNKTYTVIVRTFKTLGFSVISGISGTSLLAF